MSVTCLPSLVSLPLVLVVLPVWTRAVLPGERHTAPVCVCVCVCVCEDIRGGKEKNLACSRVLVCCIMSYAKIECCLILFFLYRIG